VEAAGDGGTTLIGADGPYNDEAFRAKATPIPVSGESRLPPESRRQQGHPAIIDPVRVGDDLAVRRLLEDLGQSYYRTTRTTLL